MAANRFSAAAAEAAEQIDTEECTAKDCATSLCNLIDVGIKGWVAMAEAAVAGPCTGSCECTESCEGVESGDPMPSDKITVEARPYARTVKVSGDFERVGIAADKISAYLLTCTPNVLPANATGFTITSADYALIGANFRGPVTLTSALGIETFTVIVAL